MSKDATDATPAELVTRIRDGDREAEASLCQRYRESVRRLIVKLCRDESRADDITHEALVTVLVKLRGDGIDNPDRLGSYIFQTARFTMIGQLRQASRIQFFESMDDHAAIDSVETHIETDEHRDLVTRMIGFLDVERDRQLLTRSYLREESKDLICEALELSSIHFDRVISRARKRLRRVVERQVDDLVDAISSIY